VLVLRLAAILVILVTAAAFLLYLITDERRFLRFAFQVFKYALILALLVAGLLVLERVVVPV
jgi:membrane protein YdbS with pleckstrin-like domain